MRAEQLQRIEELVQAMDRWNLTRVRVRDGDQEWEVERRPEIVVTGPTATRPAVQQAIEQAQASSEKGQLLPGQRYITSPLVGTFYSRSSPTANSFVQVDQWIEEGKVVAIVEAMKVMNEVQSKVRGRVIEVLIRDGQPVEYGTPLLVIEEGERRA